MDSKLEEMGIVHGMCWKEINLLKVNLDNLIRDSESSQKLFKDFISTEDAANIFGLMFFDRYMTQMLSALNMARKYNIHLEINNLDKTVINTSCNVCVEDNAQICLPKDLIDWKNTYFEKDMSYNARIGRIKMSENIVQANKLNESYGKSNMRSVEPNRNDNTNSEFSIDKGNCMSNLDNLLETLLPKKCLAEFEIGFEFEARVVHVRDYDKLEFFVCLNDDHKTLYHLSSNINFKPLSCDRLPLNDVFCVLEKDWNAKEYLLRAVAIPKGKNDEFKELIYLVDFGEVVPLTNKFKIFDSPLQYRQIAPLAIKCILEGVEDFSSYIITEQDKCKRALQNNEFGKVHLRVAYQKDRVLHVVLLRNPKSAEIFCIENCKQTNPFLNSTLFEDDLESSASFEVLQLPSSVVFNEALEKEPVLYIPSEIGLKIRVIVTHVLSPISFYGMVLNDYSGNDKTLSWNDRQISSLQKKISQPQMNDILLSQYAKDGYWYRARVIDIDSDRGLYQVFYVDFGNTEIVPLSSLAKCSKEQLKEPLHAVLFHLANLSIVPNQQNGNIIGKPNLKNGIESLVVMILDQTILVEVVERRNNDLVVRLIDPQFCEIPKMLVDMGIVREI